MSVEKIITIKGTDDSKTFALKRILEQGIMSHLHPAAKEEFETVFEEVKTWLLNYLIRIKAYNFDVSTSLNAWNESHGLGLQSVNVAVTTPDISRRPFRKNRAWKDPTIGVICPGLVGDSARTAVQKFRVDAGKGEFITSFTQGLLMDHGKLDTQNPTHLDNGNTVFVIGPDAVRTLVEIDNAEDHNPDTIRNVVNRGVYACEFLNIDPIVMNK